MGVEVLGCSFNSPAQNAAFKLTEKFEYELLSDTKKELAIAYGAAKNASAFVANRVTVVLDPEGKWVLNYPTVGVMNHPKDVLSDMQAILKP